MYASVLSEFARVCAPHFVLIFVCVYILVFVSSSLSLFFLSVFMCDMDICIAAGGWREPGDSLRVCRGSELPRVTGPRYFSLYLISYHVDWVQCQ